MTVSELIIALDTMPPDAVVCFSTEDQHGLVEIINTIEQPEIEWSNNFGSWKLSHDGTGDVKEAVWLG